MKNQKIHLPAHPVVLGKTNAGEPIPCFTRIDVQTGDYAVYEAEKEKFSVLNIVRIRDISLKTKLLAKKFIIQKIDLRNETMKKRNETIKPRAVLAETRGGGAIPCLTWLELEKGDYVVYETRREKFIVLKVCQTTNIPPKLAKKAERFIVQKIDLENYRNLTREYEKTTG